MRSSRFAFSLLSALRRQGYAGHASLFTSLRAKHGRGDWIRTSDFYVPNVALCQAELHPDFWN